MKNRYQPVLAAMIVLQIVHALEEYLLEFWNEFPPMRAMYGPELGRGVFVVFHALLIVFGVWCYRQVRRNTEHARAAMWCWVVIQSGTVVAHTIWLVFDASYQPGLATLPLFLITIALAIVVLQRAEV